MDILFNDKSHVNNRIQEEANKAIQETIQSQKFIHGKYVSMFEKNFADKLGIKNCIGVGNGTDGLYSVLMMLGIGRGDEVLIPANSWISSSEAVSVTGASPVFIDNNLNYTIDINKIEDKITKYTKALLAVHQYGNPCDIDKIINICKKYDLYLIEDCADSPFSKINGKYTGTFGDAAIFSFFPEYPLGAFGDAGAVVTNDDKLAKNIRMFTNHGQSDKYEHWMEGINSRLDTIQAAVVNIKLKYIEEWNRDRIRIAKKYTQLLADVEEVEVPQVNEDSGQIFKNYIIQAENRNELKDFLYMKRIESEILYPVPLPFHQAYKHYRHRPSDFPNAYNFKDRILALPLYPGLRNEDIEMVVEEIHNFYLVQRIR